MILDIFGPNFLSIFLQKKFLDCKSFIFGLQIFYYQRAAKDTLTKWFTWRAVPGEILNYISHETEPLPQALANEKCGNWLMFFDDSCHLSLSSSFVWYTLYFLFRSFLPVSPHSKHAVSVMSFFTLSLMLMNPRLVELALLWTIQNIMPTRPVSVRGNMTLFREAFNKKV